MSDDNARADETSDGAESTPIDAVDDGDAVEQSSAADTGDAAEQSDAADDHAAKRERRRAVARGTSLRRPGASDVDSATGGTAEAEASGDTSLGDEPTSAGKNARGGRDKLAYGLVGAAVVIGVVAAVVGIARPAARPISNDAYVNTALTSEVASVAKQAATSIYTVNMSDLGAWEKSIAGILTPGMIEEAKKQRAGITQTASALTDTKVTADPNDVVAGVALATDSHAEVLLNVNLQVQAQGSSSALQVPMKFVLDRFDGAWKVSSITQL